MAAETDFSFTAIVKVQTADDKVWETIHTPHPHLILTVGGLYVVLM